MDSSSDQPSALKAARPPSAGNLITWQWRGEFSLPASYWGIGVLGGFAIAILEAALGLFLSSQDYSPLKIFASVGLGWALIILFSIWQIVGTWRSAENYRRARDAAGRRAGWATVAQVMLLLGALSSVGQFFNTAVPQLNEASRMAFLGDPDIPVYQLRLMRNGGELEVMGGFKYGLAADFARLVDASPRLAVIHLNSIGGRIGEAEKVAKIIKSRGFETYVSASCASACVVPFLAGQERWIAQGAKLGFHEGSFGGVQVQFAREALAGFNVSQAFISRAATTPAKDMWYPTVAELSANHIITGVADDARFAMSGLGANLTPEKFGAILKTFGFYSTIETANPNLYRQLVADFRNDYLDGETLAEALPKLRAVLLPYIRSQIPLADDQTIEAFGVLMVSQLQVLRRNPAACYSYGQLGVIPGGDPNAVFAKDLLDQELSLDDRAIRTAAPRPRPTSTDLQPYQMMIARGLQQRFSPADLQLFSAKAVAPSDYSRYCNLSIGLFQVINQLPEPGRAMALRDIFWSAFQSATGQ